MHQQLADSLQEVPLRDMHTIHHDVVPPLLLLAVLGSGPWLQQQGAVLCRLQRLLLLQHDALTGSRQVLDVQGGQPVAAAAMHLHMHGVTPNVKMAGRLRCNVCVQARTQRVYVNLIVKCRRKQQ